MAIGDVLFGSVSRILSWAIGLVLIIGIIWFMIHLMKGSTRQSRKEWKWFNKEKSLIEKDVKANLQAEASSKSVANDMGAVEQEVNGFLLKLRDLIGQINRFCGKIRSTDKRVMAPEFKKDATTVMAKKLRSLGEDLISLKDLMATERSGLNSWKRFITEIRSNLDKEKELFQREAALLKSNLPNLAPSHQKQASQKYANLKRTLQIHQKQEAIYSNTLELQEQTIAQISKFEQLVQQTIKRIIQYLKGLNKPETYSELQNYFILGRSLLLDVQESYLQVEKRHQMTSNTHIQIEKNVAFLDTLMDEKQDLIRSFESIIVTEARDRQTRSREPSKAA